MKSALLFFIALFPVSSFCQSIPLDSFFVPGASWVQATYFRDFSDCYQGWGADRMEYKTERDTIVAGKNCHLLACTKLMGYLYNHDLLSGKNYFSYYGPPYSFTTNIGWIRTDSNKVYFTMDTGSYSTYYTPWVEYVLYDFNLLPGASITTSGHQSIAVAEMDSVQMSDGRFVATFSETYRKYWVYGIGSNSGLIDYAFHDPYYYTDQKLLCYDNPRFSYHIDYADSILPGNLQRNCFSDLELSVKEQPQGADEPRIFPNPLTDDNLHLVVADASQLRSVVISDVTGRSILTFSAFHNGENMLHVPRSAGTYTLRIENTDHSVVTKKIVRLQ